MNPILLPAAHAALIYPALGDVEIEFEECDSQLMLFGLSLGE